MPYWRKEEGTGRGVEGSTASELEGRVNAP